MEITGDGIKGFLETKVASGLGVVVLDQELDAEATGVRDEESAGAFGFYVENVVVEGVAGDGVKVTEFVVDGGEVGAREVSLGVAMVERWQELDVGHGSADFLKGLVVGAAEEGIGNAVALARGVTNGEGSGGKCWDKTAAMAKSEASVVTKKWLVGSAILRTGAVVMSSLSLSKAAWRRSVQAKGSVARVSSWRGHYEKLVVPEAGAKGGFVGVLLADADLVEATAEVDLGEVFGSTEAIKKFGYPRKRILVLDRDPVQGAVVRAHAEFRGVILLDEETTGTEGGGARLNESFFKEFIELALHFLDLGDGELVWGGARGGVAGLEIDGVGNTSVGR
ncbi:hypothetical protein CBR_g34352 [Chara braunii]|uniref:Uncharacterized protein n=1 Tax=Chara braunii TaxID=69332 RepID=A0A388LIN6_CHABU|nr:hypothetical protein CBR_g34352 [Chara braunii]|eukprot:GBG82072.1 hypothetical protein CBR_g34352 [Chara braunii]